MNSLYEVPIFRQIAQHCVNYFYDEISQVEQTFVEVERKWDWYVFLPVNLRHSSHTVDCVGFQSLVVGWIEWKWGRKKGRGGGGNLCEEKIKIKDFFVSFIDFLFTPILDYEVKKSCFFFWKKVSAVNFHLFDFRLLFNDSNMSSSHTENLSLSSYILQKPLSYKYTHCNNTQLFTLHEYLFCHTRTYIPHQKIPKKVVLESILPLI